MSSAKLKIPELAGNGTQSTILQAVRDLGCVSRSGIVEATHLPLSAVSRAVRPLLDRGILTETPFADTSGPRRKRGLSLDPSAGYCLAVSYSSHAIEGVILDAAYAPRRERTQPLPLDSATTDEKLQAIGDFIDAMLADVDQSFGPCLALAVVDPGIVDETTGTVLLASTMDHWRNVPIVEVLQERFNRPVMLLSTSMATIRAVDRLELKGACRNVAYIEYEEGIGCGLKLQGRYIAGHANLAGEFGHVQVTTEPIPCRCGSVGCLEAVAALPALVRNAADAIDQDSQTVLTDHNPITGKDVLHAASQHDRVAVRIVEEAFTSLGRAVGGLINMLAPERVVFDNMIKTAGPDAIATLTNAVRRSVLPTHLKALDIRISELDTHVASLGGAVAVLDYCLDY